ncbi:hypothetical protein Cgig2_024879 [Carnegiea gigantea]|uniref:FAD/NAD(P)-binding domain-containing protein n=1 Tax=Carnegiea gigantea TaxID=171969 RepID=A0A9Q1GZ97_9CARY|nr:hypothetical protein Cgig2_024879 [Carnegiea gigantea]
MGSNSSADPSHLPEIGLDGLFENLPSSPTLRRSSRRKNSSEIIKEEKLQLKEYIEENYSKIRDVEREFAYLNLELKLTAGSKNGAFEHLRKKIEIQNEKTKAAKAKEEQVRKVYEEEKKQLLHCDVVGGGPTGVEFSGELSDFIKNDVRQRYARVKDYIHVTLIEANELLSSFDDRLRHYAMRQLTKSGVRLVRGIVKDFQPEKLILSDGSELPYGLLAWSTGVGPSPFVKNLELPKSPGFRESTGKPVLPALAQVWEDAAKVVKDEEAVKQKLCEDLNQFILSIFHLSLSSQQSNNRYKRQIVAEADLGLADAFTNGHLTVVDKNDGLLNLFGIIHNLFRPSRKLAQIHQPSPSVVILVDIFE